MKNAFIFHDSFTEGFSEWYPWLATALRDMGYEVLVPTFPTPAGESFASWKVVLGKHVEEMNSETLIITHGTGGLFALRLLEEIQTKIKGLYLVAGYGEKIGNEGYDRLHTSFLEKPFSWDLIKSHVGHVRIINGTDDPFVAQELGTKLAESLGGELIMIEGGGHINKAYGYDTCEPLLEIIKKSLGQFEDGAHMEIADHDELTSSETSDLSKIIPPSEATGIEFESSQDIPSVQHNVNPTTSLEPKEPTSTPHARTMYEDMSSLVHTHQGKVVSSILTKAHTEEKIKRSQSPLSLKNILFILGTIFSLVVTLGIGFYLVQRYAPTPSLAVIPPPPSLLPAENHEKIIVTSDAPFFILEQKIRAALHLPLDQDTLRDIYYVQGDRRASWGEILSLFPSSHIPSDLLKEIKIPTGNQPTFMHGVFHATSGNAHFLIIQIEHYDQTFALLRSWEPFMIKDIGIFFDISSDFLRTRLVPDVFTDEVVANHIIRVARYHAPAPATLDEGAPEPAAISSNVFVNVLAPYKENDVMLGYFFLNEKTLIITDHLEIIPELVKRWANQQIY